MRRDSSGCPTRPRSPSSSGAPSESCNIWIRCSPRAFEGVISSLIDDLRAIVGAEHVLTDDRARDKYASDGTRHYHRPDLIVLPDGADQVSAVVGICARDRLPIVPRGAGTGYSG